MIPTKEDRQAATDFLCAAPTKFEVHWIDTGQEYGADDEVIALAEVIADTRERECARITDLLRSSGHCMTGDEAADLVGGGR